MKAIADAVRFLVFTNIYIATCVLCFTSKTALLLFGNAGNIHVNALAFSATLFLYCFHRIYRRKRLFEDEHKEERHHWVDERKTLYYVLVFLAFITAASQMYYMPLRVWLLLAPVGIIALGYSVPFIKTKNGYIRLRDISWLKVFWIGLAYAMLNTFLPVAYLYPLHSLLQPNVLFVFAENFVFIFVLAIPFDIRDVNYDRRNGVNTLPILLGNKAAIKLCLLLLCSFVFIAFLHYQFAGLSLPMLFMLIASAAETGFFIWRTKPERPNLFFPLAIESSMMIQWALLYACLSLQHSINHLL